MLVRPPALRWKDTSGFVLAAIGAAMGLEALTTVPMLALHHGGGAFIIAYLVAVVLLVVPVMILEVGVGVCFQASAPGGLRRLGRHLEWIGWWTTALGAVAALLLVIAAAWGLVLAGEAVLMILGGERAGWLASQSAAQAWWSQRIAGSEGGLLPSAGVVVALVAVWALATHILRGGMAAVGRWCTVLVPLTMALVVALGVAFLYQPGAADGVSRYLIPEWSALADPLTWSAAVRAAFITQALGLGIYIAYASHLERGSDSAGSALVIALAGAGFTFIAGFVGSAILGTLAAGAGIPVTDIHLGSLADTLAVFATAMGLLPLPAWGIGLMALILACVWSLLALSTLLGLLGAVMVAVTDTFALGWDAALRRLVPCGLILILALSVPALSAAIEHVRLGFFPTGVAAAVAMQCAALTVVGTGSNLQRHMNAYSSLHVGGVWRASVIVGTPIVLIGVAAERIQALSSDGAVLLPGIIAAVATWLAAVTLSQVHSRRRSW